MATLSEPASRAVVSEASTHATSTADAQVADANSRIAAIESERDALAAKVSQLERDIASKSVQPVTPAPPPAVQTSPAPLTAGSPAAEAGPDVSAVLASLPTGMPARLLIRYAASDGQARRQAESLASALAAQGVEVADLRESAGALRTELTFSYATDEASALRIGRLVGVAPVRRPQPKDGLMARPGAIELSLAINPRSVAMTTPRKEHSHD